MKAWDSKQKQEALFLKSFHYSWLDKRAWIWSDDTVSLWFKSCFQYFFFEYSPKLIWTLINAQHKNSR